MSAVSKKKAFLAAFSIYPSVTRAAAAAGIDRSLHYAALKKDPAYREAFQKAALEGAQAIEDEAIRRAVEGVERPVIHRGRVVEVPLRNSDGSPVKKGKRIVYVPLIEREYSDTLMQSLLRGWMPQKYGRTEITGPGGGALEANVTVKFVTPSGS